MSDLLRPLKFKSQETLQRIMMDYWTELAQAKASGKLVALCSPLFPVDILNAMDFITVANENRAATCGAAGVSTELCKIAEEQGYSLDICSYARTDIGLALGSDRVKTPIAFPKPDIILISSQCYTVYKWCENLGRLLDVPVVLVEIPRVSAGAGQEVIASARNYVKEQLLELITYLEGFTGRKFNYDRLSESLENTRRMTELFNDIQETGKKMPSPITAFDLLIHLFPMMAMRGKPEGLAYYEQFKAEAVERAAQKVAAIPDERFRIHFHVVPPWFLLRKLYSKFASAGVCPVTFFYGLVFKFEGLDPARPIDSITETYVESLLNVAPIQSVDAIAELMEDYHLDGAVFQQLRSCKAVFHPFRELAELVGKQTGLPSMTYESDMCDVRMHSDAHVDARIETFIELLESRAQQ